MALGTGAYRLSKRTTQEVMADLFGLPMSLGTIPHLEQATVAAVAAPVADAQAYVRAQPVSHLDETGWREGRARAWLWVAVTTWVTVFLVRLSRGAKVAEELCDARDRVRFAEPGDGLGEAAVRSNEATVEGRHDPGSAVSCQRLRPGRPRGAQHDQDF